jgi:hypothetical protein
MMPLADLVALSASVEPLVEIVGRAHGEQLVELVELLGSQAAEMCAETGQAGEIGGSQRSRVARRHGEEGLDRARHEVHEAPELVVVLGVAQRMARDAATVAVVIAPLRQVIAVLERRERALQRQDVQAVAREVEVADDLRPQQAHHVGEHREGEAREHLLARGRAAHALATLEHEHALSGAREIGRGHEAVVAPADHQGVVELGHRSFRARRECAAGPVTVQVPGADCDADRRAGHRGHHPLCGQFGSERRHA